MVTLVTSSAEPSQSIGFFSCFTGRCSTAPSTRNAAMPSGTLM